jgi:hypothetical protein
LFGHPLDDRTEKRKDKQRQRWAGGGGGSQGRGSAGEGATTPARGRSSRSLCGASNLLVLVGKETEDFLSVDGPIPCSASSLPPKPNHPDPSLYLCLFTNCNASCTPNLATRRQFRLPSSPWNSQLWRCIYTTRQVGNTGRVPARCDEVQYCCYHLCNCRLPVPIQYNLAAHLELSSGVHRASPRQYNAYCTDTPQHAAHQTPPAQGLCRTPSRSSKGHRNPEKLSMWVENILVSSSRV